MRRLSRTAARAGTVTAAATLAATVAATLLAAPAGADEVYPTPPDRVFTISGHGWGHGTGMSQYGALGAALGGRSAGQILDFYYPGTTDTVLAAATIRVLLQDASTTSVPVAAVPNLRVRDLASDTALVLPVGPAQWRFVADAAGMHVQYLTGTAWTTWPATGTATFAGPLRFEPAPGTVLHLFLPGGVARDYDGTITAVRAGATTVSTVNTLTREQYVAGVVPRESPASWPAAALQAQAVAARTYAEHQRTGAGGWDICNTTMCQVYGGRTLYSGGSVIDLQPPSTTAATAATAGVVRTYQGAPIFAQFSASNGGYSTPNPSFPYLTAHPDPYDGMRNPVHDWTAQISASDLARCFPAVPVVDQLVITSRDGRGDWGGRVLGVRIDGHDSSGRPHSYATTGSAVYHCRSWPANSTGLLSVYFTVAEPQSATPSGAAAGGGALDVFTRGPSGQLDHQRSVTGGPWTAPTSIGGLLTGGPSAVADPAGTVRVVLRGTNNSAYTVSSTGAGWSPFLNLGGTLAGRPALAVGGTGNADVFGPGADGQLWTRAATGASSWAGWTSLGGGIAAGTGPAATGTCGGNLAVVVRGRDGTLWLRERVGGRWGGWQPLGGAMTGDPGISSLSAGRIDVYVQGSDRALWRRYRVAGRWSPWQRLGGLLASGPTATAAAGSGRQDVFALGGNGAYYQLTDTGHWSAWQRLP